MTPNKIGEIIINGDLQNVKSGVVIYVCCAEGIMSTWNPESARFWSLPKAAGLIGWRNRPPKGLYQHRTTEKNEYINRFTFSMIMVDFFSIFIVNYTNAATLKILMQKYK